MGQDKIALLYIGNMMSRYGMNPTGVETLGAQLGSQYLVYCVSPFRLPLLRILHILLSLIRYTPKVNYIIVDVYSTGSFYYSLLVAVYCTIIRKRYIPILRGGRLPDRYEKSKVLVEFVLKGAYKVVAPSDYLGKFFESKGISHISVIPNNIEIERYDFGKRAVFHPKLLWVRAFKSLYNPKMAIEALNLLCKWWPNATLAMVGSDGDGSLAICKARSIELGIGKSVLFMGSLSKYEWTKLALEYDIFINTSDIDNTPVSVMEAMALGLPVVSTNVGGIPYLVSDRLEGLIVDKGDYIGMSRAVKELVDNPEFAAKLAFRARSKAEGFAWSSVRNLWFEILK